MLVVYWVWKNGFHCFKFLFEFAFILFGNKKYKIKKNYLNNISEIIVIFRKLTHSSNIFDGVAW